MPTLDLVQGIFSDVLGVPAPGATDDLLDAGLLDSLMLIQLLAELETACTIEIPLEVIDLDEIRTLARIAALVDRLSGALRQRPPEPAHRLLASLREGTAGAPVFLIPGGEGPSAVLVLRPLAQALRTTRPVYGLATGPLDSGHRLPRVEDMADACAEAIRSVAGAATCVIAGVSFGGLVAFETARRLELDGGPTIETVILVDARPAAPNLGAAAYRRYRAQLPLRVARWLALDPRTRLPAFAAIVLGKLRAPVDRAGQTEAPKPAEAPRWRTIATPATEGYRVGRYRGDVKLLVTDDPGYRRFDPTPVWSAAVDGNFAVQRIAGDHTNFLRGSRLPGAAASFSASLPAVDPRARLIGAAGPAPGALPAARRPPAPPCLASPERLFYGSGGGPPAGLGGGYCARPTGLRHGLSARLGDAILREALEFLLPLRCFRR